MSDNRIDKDKINQVTFANHMQEFMRFYKKHRELNDEITGLKKINYYDNNSHVEFNIDKTKFEYAIKRLSAFVIDNIQYVKNKKDAVFIEKEVEQLEDDFNDDARYKTFVSKEGSMSDSNKIEFNISYFKYVMRCFNLSNKLNVLLQESLMISTADIKKSVQFYDLKVFYEQLGYYRDEISNDLSLFKYTNIINHTLRMFGYYFTYKIMVNRTEEVFIDKLVNICLKYLQDSNVLKLISDAQNINLISKNRLNEIKNASLDYKRILKEIYKLVNKSLSDLGILPRIGRKRFIDTSLI